jgi:hypothetical protein
MGYKNDNGHDRRFADTQNGEAHKKGQQTYGSRYNEQALPEVVYVVRGFAGRNNSRGHIGKSVRQAAKEAVRLLVVFKSAL